MKSFSFLILFALILLAACRKSSVPVPDCIQSKIAEFSNSSCEHGAKIEEYIFQGETVFLFSLGFCGADLGADVVDKNCSSLGALGGFTGNTKINGEEFTNASFVRKIWSR